MAAQRIAQAARQGGSGSLTELVGHLQGVIRDLLDPYRPEMHYMRGPGPKWHAKHDHISAEMIPGLVRVRVKR
jgi:hypothetical protein